MAPTPARLAWKAEKDTGEVDESNGKHAQRVICKPMIMEWRYAVQWTTSKACLQFSQSCINVNAKLIEVQIGRARNGSGDIKA